MSQRLNQEIQWRITWILKSWILQSLHFPPTGHWPPHHLLCLVNCGFLLAPCHHTGTWDLRLQPHLWKCIKSVTCHLSSSAQKGQSPFQGDRWKLSASCFPHALCLFPKIHWEKHHRLGVSENKSQQVMQATSASSLAMQLHWGNKVPSLLPAWTGRRVEWGRQEKWIFQNTTQPTRQYVFGHDSLMC